MFDKDGKKDKGHENYLREYLGKLPEADDQFKKAYQAWLSYLDQYEAYEQQVCRGRTKHGLAMPQTTEEMRLCNQKGRLLRQELFEQLRRYKVNSETEASAKRLAEQEHERKWSKR